MGLGIGERDIRVLAVAATVLLATAAVFSLPGAGGDDDAPYVVPVQDAGTVILRKNPPDLEVTSTNPASGWRVDVTEPSGPVVSVSFQQGQRRLDMSAELADGKILVHIQERLSGSVVRETVTELAEQRLLALGAASSPQSTVTTRGDPSGIASVPGTAAGSPAVETTIATTTSSAPTTTTTRPVTTTRATTTTTRPTTTTTEPVPTVPATAPPTPPPPTTTTTTTSAPTTTVPTTTTLPTTTTTIAPSTTTTLASSVEVFQVREAGIVEVICVENDHVSPGGIAPFPGWEYDIDKDGPKSIEVDFQEIPRDDDHDVEKLTFKAHAHDGCEIHAQIKSG